MLKKLFGPKRDELSTEFKIFHNEEPCNLYSPPNIVRVVKFKKLWTYITDGCHNKFVQKFGDELDAWKTE
jgi:hypothetical protein